MADITEAEVQAAQAAWAEGIVDIGRVFQSGGDYRARAQAHIDQLYAYRLGAVIFKPTMVSEILFRKTAAGALSYFVGGDRAFSEDRGFALKPWGAVRFENSGIVCQGSTAFAMGNYYFTDQEGQEIKVEYSFAYVRGVSGEILINLHHSSMSYSRDES